VGDSLPVGLKDVSEYPNLLRVLLERGYTEAELEKICSGNIFRVWQAALDFADRAARGEAPR
jgi:membrane dipeptidase